MHGTVQVLQSGRSFCATFATTPWLLLYATTPLVVENVLLHACSAVHFMSGDTCSTLIYAHMDCKRSVELKLTKLLGKVVQNLKSTLATNGFLGASEPYQDNRRKKQ